MTRRDDVPPRPTRALGRSPRRLFGGYGPLLALMVAFLLIVTLVPTIARQQIVLAQGPSPTAPPAAGATGRVGPAAKVLGSPPEVGGAARKAGSGAPRTKHGAPRAGGETAGPTAATGPRAAPGQAKVVAAAGACSARRTQVVGDPYSPPCSPWPSGGDNGGPTGSGVTKDRIRVSFRLPVENIYDFQSVIGQLAGDKARKIPSTTEADFRRTMQDFATYFERNFQMYGRKLELVYWKGKGSVFNEFLGAGQDAAQADAIHAAKELKVFADISAFTQPYNEKLARQGVISIGAPYLSRQWFEAQQPYSWSPWPDCTTLTETIAEYLNKRAFGRPADHAGPGVLGRPRTVALIAPDNPEYQQCVDAGERIVNAAGNKAQRYSYTIDLARLSDQANTLAARLKQDSITTVVLVSDPLLPLLMASRMSQQHYYPEWVVTGTALTDRDQLGQLYDRSQWQHAFGLSMLGEEQPQEATFAYAAAKSVDPGHEPIFGADIFYRYFYLLATGIQMAGPDLTPQTFAAGMRAYPRRGGPEGTWAYPSGAYGPNRDAREIWWDPDATSLVNGAPGRYASTNRRYSPGTWPTGPAAPQLLHLAAGGVSRPPEEL